MSLKKITYKLYYSTLHLVNRFFEFNLKKGDDYKNIPIIINNRNRYTFLLKLINSLVVKGYHNIHIIDNDSSYPPLLEYYEHCPYKIYRLKKNLGHLALWKSGLHQNFNKNYYVYTDPDIEIIEDCPEDFMKYLIAIIEKNYKIQKIGFGLKYDDLPDHFSKKNEVIEWEKRFYKNPYADNLYIANVDTTFALYRPRASGGSHDFKLNIRTSFPYQCRHLPWYLDSANMPDEEIFYMDNAKTSTFWTSK